MTTQVRILTAAVLTGFAALTVFALEQYGPVGLFESLLSTLPGWLALADLTIALSLVLVWMWQDGRAHGRAFVPYALLTATLGSVGPLLYLLLHRDRDQARLAGRRAA